MCGFVGALSFGDREGIQPEIIGPVRDLAARRGPDARGLWTDGESCTLGFCRLSILDLSPAGNQPMHTSDGRFHLVFNGELYNFRELRRELESIGVAFHSTGDAEVVLQALSTWGEAALGRFNGMFALGHYDEVEGRLLVARDHAGIKPLYVARSAKGFLVASQFDQVLSHPWCQNCGLDSSSIGLFFRLGYIPAPRTALAGVSMMEAGTWLEIGRDGKSRAGRYFEFPRRPKSFLAVEDGLEAADAAIAGAVRRQLVSDVPVGLFLSGGIDSPLVAAMMREAVGGPFPAFTIGTDGGPTDEGEDAQRYAAEIGLDHRLARPPDSSVLELIQEAVSACSEPFADSSIFPTLMVSRNASRDVKVVLSGDGGDELFWGYEGRFGSVLKVCQEFGQPYWYRSARRGLKRVLGLGSAQPNIRFRTLGHWYREKHSRLPEHWLERILPGLPPWSEETRLFDYDGSDPDETADWMRWNEFVGHLTMVLLKVDRASMHHSLEVRVPLLDREVIDAAIQLRWGACLDLKRSVGKLPLRRALARRVQHQTPGKRGFSPPLGEWMRGPLLPLLEEVLLRRDAILNVSVDRAAMRALVRAHQTREADFGWGLWVLLSGALWEDRYLHKRRLQPSPAATETSVRD
jgi:asparagine synthase (glutamine-hydrolysing)